MKKNGTHNNNEPITCTNPFNLFPREIMHKILEGLDFPEIWQFRQTCKSNKYEVDHYPAQRIYFAVGKLLPLYEYKYSLETHSYTLKAPKKVTSADVLQSISRQGNTIKLFYNLSDALDYQNIAAPHEYKETLDVFLPTQTAALFVVSIKNGTLVRSKTLELEEYWKKDILWSYGLCVADPKLVFVDCLDTPAYNLENVYFSKFEAKLECHFFNKRNTFFKQQAFPEDFYLIWDQIMQSEIRNLSKTSLRAVSELFKNYSDPFYSKLTRHNQDKVNDILKSINLNAKDKNAELKKLLYFLNRLKEEAKVEKKKPTGHYCLMLDFAITNLEQVVDISHLDDIKNYLSVS